MKPKEYKIDSLEDILNTLSTENYGRFLVDVINSFTFYLTTIEETKKQYPELAHLKNTEIANFGFTWIDDGKTDVKWITIKGPNGQETKITFDNKKHTNG